MPLKFILPATVLGTLLLPTAASAQPTSPVKYCDYKCRYRTTVGHDVRYGGIIKPNPPYKNNTFCTTWDHTAGWFGREVNGTLVCRRP
jgi:hypothetical protein